MTHTFTWYSSRAINVLCELQAISEYMHALYKSEGEPSDTRESDMKTWLVSADEKSSLMSKHLSSQALALQRKRSRSTATRCEQQWTKIFSLERELKAMKLFNGTLPTTKVIYSWRYHVQCIGMDREGPNKQQRTADKVWSYSLG
jgi:hypothetical protein